MKHGRGSAGSQEQAHYHLGQLEKSGLIYSNDDGKRKGFFITSEVQYFDRKIISTIRMRTPRHIIIFLLTKPDATFREILANFNFTKGALSFQLKRLVKSGILSRGKMEKESTYKVVETERVRNLLITYRASIADDVLDGVVDLLARI